MAVRCKDRAVRPNLPQQTYAFKAIVTTGTTQLHGPSKTSPPSHADRSATTAPTTAWASASLVCGLHSTLRSKRAVPATPVPSTPM